MSDVPGVSSTLQRMAGQAEPQDQEGRVASRTVILDNGDTLELKAVQEQTRTYLYANDRALTLEGVVRVGIVKSGGHRIELSNGYKIIPSSDWLGIKLDVPEWSF